MSKEELQRELDALNDQIEALLDKREAWIQEHLADFSELQVGDEVWDGRSGRKLGVVESLYHAKWGRSGEVRRESMGVYAQYKDQRGFLDNTSRQMDIWPMTKEKALSMAEGRVRAMRSGISLAL